MRIRYLQTVELGYGQRFAPGDELDVPRGTGELAVARGLAAEVLPDGKLRQRRGRPRRKVNSAGEEPHEPGSRPPGSSPVPYRRGDLRPEA